jgi:ankyrin repeat protein
VQQDRGLLVAIGGHDEGYTPLTAAAWGGHVEVMRYLLEEGAQVNLQDEADFTALGCACEQGYTEAIHVLLAHGADAALAFYDGHTPLMMARRPWLWQCEMARKSAWRYCRWEVVEHGTL